MDDLALRALVAGCGVALVAGPLGSFVVWRRMAYFGDTLSHAALLGLALGVLAGVAPMAGVAVVCLFSAVLLTFLHRLRNLSADTLLGILAHGGLAVGLVVVAFLPGVRVDLMGYLFGDILAVDGVAIAWIHGGGAVLLAALFALWRPLLSITVHEDLAAVEGVPVRRVRLAFALMIAVAVAAAMKVVGILLVTSLLIVPAAAARRFARTPAGMAMLAAAMGCLSVAGGLFGAFTWDAPAGPAIVTAALALFVAGLAVPTGQR